ncbi:MAG: PKD domain-containing protein [Bacteroidales bacterium]|nr:PKD domain-containing protein [Bacteroidales bacterium]
MIKKLRFSFILLILFLFSFGLLNAQGVSTKGKDFWFGFMSNYGNAADYLRVYITSTVNTSGTVSVPGIGFSQNFTVTANTTTSVTVPNGAMMSANNTVQTKGVHVVSNDTISVYALNYQPYTSDATVIFPVNTLDREYRVGTIKGWPGDWGVQYLIVATENNTTVKITPMGGASFNVNLNAGQCYQVGSANDLTGAFIEDFSTCKRVAVFVGNVCTNIGGCVACDHLCEQILPVSKLGKNFVTVPFSGKSKDYFRITANENATQVTINGGAPINLNAGQVHQFSTGTASYIQTTKPSLVMQYAQGGSCDGVGDPFSVMVPPIEQSIDNITFNAFTSSIITSYYVNIVTRTAYASLLTLDGAPRPFTPVPGNPAYSYTRAPITQGNHTIVSDSGLVAMVYGFGSYESYGYNVGFSLKNLIYDFTVSDDTVCPGESITFTTLPYPDVINYQWDFGDGNSATGLSVTHQYANLGEYIVSLILTTTDGCSSDTIQKNVVVDGPEIEITGIDTICFGDTLVLHAHSYGVSNLVWNTGSTDSILVVVPQTHTIYTATGTMVNNPVCPAFGSFSVYVIKPLPDFSFQSVCEGVAVSFTDLSVVDSIYFVNSWQWDFGDGTTSTLQNPTHVYADGGTYNVILTVTSNTGCTSSISKPVTIYYKPAVDFNFTNVCQGETTQFTNTTTIQGGGMINSFAWNFGDTSSINTNPNPTHVYANHGNFNVTLNIVTNQGCIDSTTKTVSVYDYPVAAFTFNNVCLSDSAVFTNNSTEPLGTIDWFQWQYGDNSSPDNTNYNGIHLYPTAGTYNVTLTVESNFGCRDSVNQSIEIYPMPSAIFTHADVCFKDSVHFVNSSIGTVVLNQWNFGYSSIIDTTTSPVHLFPSPGIYSTLLTVSTDHGCIDSIRHDVEIFTLPDADFYFANACDGFPVNFLDSSSVPSPDLVNQWVWDFGDSSPINTIENPSHLYNSSGTYNVELVVSTLNGCKDSIIKIVTTYPNPELNFEAEQAGCSQFCTQFSDLSTISGGSIVIWQWDFGNGTNSYGPNPNACFTNNSGSLINFDVTLTAISNQNCTTVITKPDYITVYPLPIAAFTYFPHETTVLEPVIHFHDHSIGAAYWYWNFGDNSQINNYQNPFHLYEDTGTYLIQLLVENIYGCVDSTQSSVTVQPDWSIYIPSAFTPNGDADNDYFMPKGYGIDEFEMMIFNRWGDLIFVSNDLMKGWDGRINDGSSEVCPQDVYVYKINIRTISRIRKSYIGHFTLIKPAYH